MRLCCVYAFFPNRYGWGYVLVVGIGILLPPLLLITMLSLPKVFE